MPIESSFYIVTELIYLLVFTRRFFLPRNYDRFTDLGDGHIDVTMMFFVLLAFYLTASRRLEWALVALVASILIKYITILLLPLFLVYALQARDGWRPRLAFLGRSSVASSALVMLFYWPFWQGFDTFKGFLGQANIFISSLPTIISLHLQYRVDPGTSSTISEGLTVAAFLGFYVWRLKGLKKGLEQKAVVGTETLFAYLVIACAQFESWYVIWPITLAALTSHRDWHERTAALSFGTLISVALFAYVWRWTQMSFLVINVAAVLAILLPPLGLWSYRSSGLGQRRTPDRTIGVL